MENYLVEAFNEMNRTSYTSLKEIKAEWGEREIFDSFLRYEGLIGYTTVILEVIKTLKEITI